MRLSTHEPPSETISHETSVLNCRPCQEHLEKIQVYVEGIIHSNKRRNNLSPR